MHRGVQRRGLRHATDARAPPATSSCPRRRAAGYDAHVLLIDGSFLSTPDHDLNDFVEHALGRGKDCVAYLDVDQSEAGVSAVLALEKNPAGRVVANPEVVSVAPYPDGLNRRRDQNPTYTVPSRCVARCGSSARPPYRTSPNFSPTRVCVGPNRASRQTRSFGRLLAFLAKRETFHALKMKHCFKPAAQASASYRYVDSLFGFLAGERRRATGRYKSGWASGGASGGRADRRKILLERFAIQDRRAGDARERAVSAETDADVLVPRFNAAYGRPVLPEDPYAQRGDELPARFTDAGAWTKFPPRSTRCT